MLLFIFALIVLAWLQDIGRAIADSKVPREELYLADKISFPQSYSASGVNQASGVLVCERRNVFKRSL